MWWAGREGTSIKGTAGGRREGGTRECPSPFNQGTAGGRQEGGRMVGRKGGRKKCVNLKLYN
jgi:hypothetical protein